MKRLRQSLATACLLVLVVAASAAGQESDAGHSGHAVNDGMSVEGDMAALGSQVIKGVRASAHIKDVSSAMAEMGVKASHHFMMEFVDEQSGEQIGSGTVALKLTNPDAKISDTIELVGMDGHFGADIILDMSGEYHFRIGSKLADGIKRKYHFHFKN